MITIWHISDTHGNHNKLIPPEVDMVIFSGDGSNYQEPISNSIELEKFIFWFSKLPIKYKIFVCGNHDTSIERGTIRKEIFESHGIIYLENSSFILDGKEFDSRDYKFYGSPITPSFNTGWSWNVKRHKINKVWDMIPDDTDVLITHGPPKGVLDLAYRQDGKLEQAGCANLMKQVRNRIKPNLHLFGHIHNSYSSEIFNSGIRKINSCDTLFSNGSVSVDGKMESICSNGNILTLE